MITHANETCDCCGQPLRYSPVTVKRKVGPESNPLTVTLCMTCNSVHQPMLNALDRAVRVSAVGLD